MHGDAAPLGLPGLFPAADGVGAGEPAFLDLVQGHFLAADDLAEMVLDMVDGDPVEPGPEFGIEAEIGQMEVGLDEDVLGQILGRGRVAHEAEG